MFMGKGNNHFARSYLNLTLQGQYVPMSTMMFDLRNMIQIIDNISVRNIMFSVEW